MCGRKGRGAARLQDGGHVAVVAEVVKAHEAAAKHGRELRAVLRDGVVLKSDVQIHLRALDTACLHPLG